MKLRSTSLLIAPLLALACGSNGAPGKDGQDGQDGLPGDTGTPAEAASTREPSINMIEPRVGLVDRRLDVTISTDARIDLSKAKVDFGAGVSVKKVEPRGSALVATIDIAPDAKLGKHDVVVTAGGQKLTAKHGFVVAVHLDAKVGAGKAEQGGLVRLDISNRDKIWFDTERFRLFPLANPKDASLIALAHLRFTPTDGSVIFLGDPLAKTGSLGFLGFNDPNDADSASYLTEYDAVSVAARAPVPLTPDTPVDVTFEDELQTGFFSADLAPGGAKEGVLVEAWAKVPPGSTMQPLLLAYPASGHVADLLDQGINDPGFPMFGIPPTEARVAYPVTSASKAYFVVLDAQLGHGPTTKMSLAYSAVRGQVFAEKPGVHSLGESAQGLGSLPGIRTAVPARIVDGELTAPDEVDVYKLTGLSTKNPTDMLVSVVSDADVVVRVDTVPTFDSDHVVELVQGGKAGMSTTTAFVGAERYIQISGKPDAAKQTGKYTLGIKRIAQPVVHR